MKRKISALLVADIVGYSKLMAGDDEQTARQLASHRALFEDLVSFFSGRIVNAAGDSILAEFPSAVEAVRCAIDVQESLRTRNLGYPTSQQMNWRIGVTIGDVVERDEDLMGDGVNIAARLEGLAPPGGVCVSQAVYDQVRNKLSARFIDIGERVVKNIPFPVHAYTLAFGPAVEREVRHSGRSAQQRIWGWRLAGSLAAGVVLAGVYHLIGTNPRTETPEIVLQAARAQDLGAGQRGRRPCAQLRMICQQAGFQRGAAAGGYGLWKDCMLPLLRGTPQRMRATKALPQAAPETVAACRDVKSRLWRDVGSKPQPAPPHDGKAEQRIRRPCAQLRMICRQAGFQRGAAVGGYGLWRDCMFPLLRGTPQRMRATKALPQAAPETVAACRDVKSRLWRDVGSEP